MPGSWRWTRSCRRQGWVGSKRGIVGRVNSPISGKSGAPSAVIVGQPAVVAVAKADRLLALDQRDPVEDAAAHIARALPRIGAAPGDQHRLLAGLELPGQLLVAALAEQAAADRGNADEPGIELDEGRVGCGRVRRPVWRTAAPAWASARSTSATVSRSSATAPSASSAAQSAGAGTVASMVGSAVEPAPPRPQAGHASAPSAGRSRGCCRRSP